MRAQRLNEDLEQSVESIQQMSWIRMQKSIQRDSKGALSKVRAAVHPCECVRKEDEEIEMACRRDLEQYTYSTVQYMHIVHCT